MNEYEQDSTWVPLKRDVLENLYRSNPQLQFVTSKSEGAHFTAKVFLPPPPLKAPHSNFNI